MAAFVPHRSNKYFHVIASNGIVSSSPYIMTASPTASVRVFETIRDADVVTLRSVRSQRCRCEIARSSCRTIIDSGEASGPSSSGNTLPSSIHGRVARRSALPRERFSPLTRLGHWLRPGWLPVIKVNLASFEDPIFLDRVALAAPPCGSDLLRHVPPMT